MEQWKEYKANDFCLKVTDGTHDSPKPKANGKHYLITSKHLKSGGIDFSSAYKISEEDYQKVIERSKVEKFDILFSMIGTIGNIYRESSDNIEYAVKNMAIFKCGGDSVKSSWLYYWLQSPKAKEYINSRLTGSTQGYLTLDTLRNFPIDFPSFQTAIKIVSILSSIDDKIEVNRKINSNLEEQAKALFKSWFIDFEPFKGGKFVDSELGMIPKIWMILPFESFISESQDKAMVGFYPAYSVTNNGITPRTEKFKKQLSKATSKEKILRKDDLVFGMSRQILNWGIMQDKIGSVSSAYHVYKIDKEKVNPTYLRYFIKGYQTYFKDLIGTAAREGQSLDKGALMSKIILIPSQDVLQSFLRNITAIEDAVSLLKAQCSRLSSLRDTLLPKLMSGEIEVK
jgi:type I restriction enzyme S subunit